jgi:hypothetical protein
MRGREENAAELRAEFEALLASAPKERRDWLEVAGRHAERSERFLLNPPQTVTRLGRIKGSVAYWWNALGDPEDNSLRKLVAVVPAFGVWLVAREYETPMQSLGRGFRHELYVAFHGGVWVPLRGPGPGSGRDGGLPPAGAQVGARLEAPRGARPRHDAAPLPCAAVVGALRTRRGLHH